MSNSNLESPWEIYLASNGNSDVSYQRRLFLIVLYPDGPLDLPTQDHIDAIDSIDESIQQNRLSACAGCPNFDKETNFCMISKCNMIFKVKFPFSSCPIDKWSSL